MLGDKMRVQQGVSSSCTDDQLLFIRQQGIRHVFALFEDQHTDYDSVMRFVERVRKFNLTITDAGNTHLYKNPQFHLGLSERDRAIEEYNRFNRVLAKAGIPIVYMTWEPNQVLSTAYRVSDHTQGAVGRIVDIEEMKKRPFTHGRQYTEEEIWENFRYWLDRVLPVCEEEGLTIALHPNDPPMDCLVGIPNLIHSADCYKKAFAMANDSPRLGMKMCFGCWLEGGEAFGDLLSDIAYFVDRKKVLIVHFRNVSSPMPYFEETLLEDGYMNMYEAMKQLVRHDYDGLIHVDHVPEYVESCGGKNASMAYSTGYMKGLLHSAMQEVHREMSDI